MLEARPELRQRWMHAAAKNDRAIAFVRHRVGEVPKRATTRAEAQIADHFAGSTLTAITTDPSYPRGPQR